MTAPRTIERIPLANLVPFAANPRTHSDAQIEQIAKSIQEFGWTTPILIDENSGIIAGHGRLAAAQRLGLNSVDAIRIEGLTDAQRKALVIADNNLALNAGWDRDKLNAIVAELKDADFDITLLGFPDNEFATAAEDVGVGDYDEQFQIVIMCANEQQQIDYLQQITALGIECRALMR